MVVGESIALGRILNIISSVGGGPRAPTQSAESSTFLPAAQFVDFLSRGSQTMAWSSNKAAAYLEENRRQRDKEDAWDVSSFSKAAKAVRDPDVLRAAIGVFSEAVARNEQRETRGRKCVQTSVGEDRADRRASAATTLALPSTPPRTLPGWRTPDTQRPGLYPPIPEETTTPTRDLSSPPREDWMERYPDPDNVNWATPRLRTLLMEDSDYPNDRAPGGERLAREDLEAKRFFELFEESRRRAELNLLRADGQSSSSAAASSSGEEDASSDAMEVELGPLGKRKCPGEGTSGLPGTSKGGKRKKKKMLKRVTIEDLEGLKLPTPPPCTPLPLPRATSTPGRDFDGQAFDGAQLTITESVAANEVLERCAMDFQLKITELLEKVRASKVPAALHSYILGTVQALQISFQDTRKVAVQAWASAEASRENVGHMKQGLYAIADALKIKVPQNGEEASYAAAAGRPRISRLNIPTSKAPRVAMVYPKDEDNVPDSAATEALLKAAINPAEDGFKVVRMRRIKKKGVLVQAEQERDIERMIDGTLGRKLDAGGLKAAIPTRRGPRILIYDVPRDLEDAELVKTIFELNIKGKGMDLNTFKDQFKLAFRTGPRNRPETNWVVNSSAAVRNLLRAEGRVYIGWASCRVVDFLGVTRCFRCCAFGHVAAKCSSTAPTCGHCGESGHEKKGCPKGGQPPSCANCKRAGKNGVHEVDDQECPALQYALRRECQRTTWE